MGIRFRRSVRLFPGVRLNVTTRGVSATLGPRGASINVGRNGTYANVGIPGTGLSSRTRLDRPKDDAQQWIRAGQAAPSLAKVVGWVVVVGLVASVLFVSLS